MTPVRFHRAARDEVREAMLWYRRRASGLDAVFLAAFQEAVERVQEYPEIRPPSGDGARIMILHRFPYGIVYLYEESRIDVVAVMHLHRRPGYWRNRLA